MSMILYNMRYRGPYEYDKFILNTFQLSNEVKMAEKHLKEKEEASIKESENTLDSYLDQYVGEKSSSMKLLLLELDLGIGEREND